MSLGDAWSETTPGSTSKLNKVTVISGTGTYIASLTKANHILFRANDSTGGLTADHLYMVNAAGDVLIDLSDINEHDHTSSNTGGKLIDLLAANYNTVDSGSRFMTNPKKSSWIEVISGTSAVSDVTDGVTFEDSIKLDTGATISSVAQIKQVAGVNIDMSKRSFFACLIAFGTASSLAARVGFGSDSLGGADNDTKKYNAEVCTTTNNNWWLRTATGGARSATDSGISAMTVNQQSVRLDHQPDIGTPKVDMYIDEGTVFTKTSNIPTSAGGPAFDNIIRCNIKNNTAASRTLFVYGVRFAYQAISTWV